MACDRFTCDYIDANSAQSRSGAREVRINNFLREADSFENLSAGVRGDGRDSHLRHNFQNAFTQGLN